MKKEEVIINLIDYAGKVFRCDTSKLSGATVIAEELGTKSLNRLAMCSLIENNLDVVIPIADFGKYKTISDLADRVLSELN